MREWHTDGGVPAACFERAITRALAARTGAVVVGRGDQWMGRQWNGMVARPIFNPAGRNGALGHAVGGGMEDCAVEGAGHVGAHS